MFSPKTAQADDVFLTVMPMSDDKAPELPLALAETPATFALTLADRVVVLSKTGRLIDAAVSGERPGRPELPVAAGRSGPGQLEHSDRGSRLRFNAQVEAGKNTAFVVVPGGRFTVQPEAIPGASVLVQRLFIALLDGRIQRAFCPLWL